MPVHTIKLTFPVPVDVPAEALQALGDIAAWICEAYEAANPGRKMWPGGTGQEMITNPLALGDDEALQFDAGVYVVEASERMDFSWPCACCGTPQGDHHTVHSHEFQPHARIVRPEPSLAFGRPVLVNTPTLRAPGAVRGWVRDRDGRQLVAVGHPLSGSEDEVITLHRPRDVAALDPPKAP